MASHYNRLALTAIIATITSLLSTLSLLNAYTVEQLPSPKSIIGTGAHWCEETNSLYYVDVNGTECTFLRYSCSENKTYCANAPGYPYINSITPVEGKPGEYAAGTVHNVEIFRWNGRQSIVKQVRTALTVENCTEFGTNFFSAAKADQRGRLFCGTRRVEFCADLEKQTYANLFRFARDEPAVTLNEPKALRLSNGMAWCEKTSKFYHIDTCGLNIKEYKYNPDTGDISNGRILFNFTEDGQPAPYLPAGLNIDKECNLYATTFGGSKMVVVDSKTGRKKFDILFPAALVGSSAWGGKNLDELYVTTASYAFPTPQTPESGYLYVVRGLGVIGCHMYKARV